MTKGSNAVGLIITDGGARDWIAAVTALDSPCSRWEVLPLGISPDLCEGEYRAALNRLGIKLDVSVADVVGAAEEARAELRRAVPQFFFDLRRQPIDGTRTFQDLFVEEGLNVWWLLEISEKSAYRGCLLNRFYYLALIRQVIAKSAYQEVRLALRDRALVKAVTTGLPDQPIRNLSPEPAGFSNVWSLWQSLCFLARYFSNGFGIALLHLLQHWMMKGLDIARPVTPPPHSILFFSFYPGMWSRPYTEEASEWFFGSLPNAFPACQPVRYGLWLTAGPAEIWRRRRELRVFFKRNYAVLLTLFAGLRTVADVLAPAGFLRAIRLGFKWQYRVQVGFLGFDVGPLVAEEVLRSASSTEYFRDRLIVRALKLATAAAPLAALVYRLEFQPFENALLYGIRGRARAIAVQHSWFGQNYLPYFFVPGELSSSRTREGRGEARPLPDLVLTSGHYGRDVMMRNGLTPESVEVCGPVRYSRLLRLLAGRRDRAALRAAIGCDPGCTLLIVATAVSREEASGLFAALRQVLLNSRSLTDKTYVFYKSHQALLLGTEFVNVVGTRLGRDRYQILDPGTEFYDVLAAADALVLTSSTLFVEAVILGVLPIVYDSGAVFDPKAVEPEECGGILVRNAAGLTDALHRVIRRDPSLEYLKTRWPALISYWFDRLDCDPNERVIEILKRRGYLPVSSGTA